MVVYITTQGAKIVKEGRHLLVKKGTTIYHTLFTYKLRQVVILGNVKLSPPALRQLMLNNIDTVFLSRDGRYIGRITPPESKNVFLRKRQYDLIDDTEFGVKIARCIVAGKLANMATVLMRIRRTRKNPIPGQRAESIHQLMRKLEEAGNIEAIRGYEGRGSALYFEGFANGLIENMGFRKRIRRPPTDPVNSVLSLLYTFLMNRVYAAVRIAGLDPYPGFLHSLDYGRHSLVLDLMEEFRSIVAETLTLSLFNLKILQRKDFYVDKSIQESKEGSEDTELPDVTKDPIGRISGDDLEEKYFDIPEQRMIEDTPALEKPTGRYPVKLKEDAFKRVIEAFEKKLTTSFYYPPAGKRMTYNEVIIYQANHFRKVIEGDIEVYQPVLLK